jgi:AraC family transcriptional regulator, positive regulator of tynA and feaB
MASEISSTIVESFGKMSPNTPEQWREAIERSWGMKCEFADSRPSEMRATQWLLGGLHMSAAATVAQEWTWLGEPSRDDWRHDMMVLNIVQGGCVDIEQAGVRLQMTEGSMILLDASRKYTQTIAEGTTGISVRVPRSALEQRGMRPGGHEMFLADPASAETRILRSWIELTAAHGRDARSATHTLIAEHMVDLMQILAGAHPDALKSNTRADAVFSKAKRFMERNIGNDRIDLPTIAHAIGVSSARLSRAFAGSGTTVMRFLWQLRLERAKAMLSDPQVDLRISEIAWQCGFVNAAHFSRAFRKQFGTTPRASLGSLKSEDG